MLTPKQKAFADYYIELGNATEAYKRAYKNNCSSDSARVNANKILTKDYVKNYIDERMAQKDNSNIASQNEVLEYLTKVMRGEIKEECVVTESIGDYMSEAKLIQKQVSPKDRNKAAELLGKRYRLFTENVDLNANVGVQIVDDIE